jgi:hypothetical protein
MFPSSTLHRLVKLFERDSKEFVTCHHLIHGVQRSVSLTLCDIPGSLHWYYHILPSLALVLTFTDYLMMATLTKLNPAYQNVNQDDLPLILNAEDTYVHFYTVMTKTDLSLST